jgi:hypothetical protein
LKASYALDHLLFPSHVLINYNDLHRLILIGSNRLLSFDYLCTLFTSEIFLGSTCYCFMWIGYGDTIFMITLFIIFLLLLFMLRSLN